VTSVASRRKIRRLILSPEKPFDLLVYAKQIACAFAEFGCKETKRKKNLYALNVLEFIDGFASEGRETSESSNSEGFVTESTAT